MKRIILLLTIFLFSFEILLAGNFKDKADTALISKIRNEAMQNNKASSMLTGLCDKYGPRLNFSPAYQASSQWIEDKLHEFGITQVQFEPFDLEGKSWELNKFYLTMTEPFVKPIIACPKEYTYSTNGIIKSEVVYLEAKDETELEKYKGKLKGKIVMIADPSGMRPYTDPFVKRLADSSLTKLQNEKIPTAEEREKSMQEEKKGEEWYLQYIRWMSKKVEFCKEEDAALLLDCTYSSYGILQVWSNISPVEPNNIYDYLVDYAPRTDLPASLPQVTISMEQYNSIIRLLKKGETVKMETRIDVTMGKPQKGFNVVAEIPGSEQNGEVVMLGAHLDSHFAGYAATDNTIGVVTCMEVLRIFKTLGIQPKRTIRIGLWGAEELGLIGSKSYIKNHFENNSEKCYAYFNMDNGAGKFRGVYAQENTGAASLFSDWMKIINEPCFQTVCISNTKDTDHISFDEAGLPGFQFIQDPLDYYKIYHTTMDAVERIPKDDLKENVFLMTMMAYLAANHSGDFPVKSKATK